MGWNNVYMECQIKMNKNQRQILLRLKTTYFLLNKMQSGEDIMIWVVKIDFRKPQVEQNIYSFRERSLLRPSVIGSSIV